MNPIALETQLIARLREQVDCHRIGSEANFIGTVEYTEPTIIVGAPEVAPMDDNAESGQIGTERQTWPIFVVVPISPDKRGLSANFQKAGALIGDVIHALAGFRPGKPYHEAIVYQGRPKPIGEPGWVYFPVEFAARYAFSGADQ